MTCRTINIASTVLSLKPHWLSLVASSVLYFVFVGVSLLAFDEGSLVFRWVHLLFERGCDLLCLWSSSSVFLVLHSDDFCLFAFIIAFNTLLWFIIGPFSGAERVEYHSALTKGLFFRPPQIPRGRPSFSFFLLNPPVSLLCCLLPLWSRRTWSLHLRGPGRAAEQTLPLASLRIRLCARLLHSIRRRI